MKRIFTNGGSRDFVARAFDALALKSSVLLLAAPFFDYSAPLLSAVSRGQQIQLLIGLNAATRPEAISAVLGASGITVRYLTDRFHAKIYLFDDAAIVGSANLTNAGFMGNREAIVVLDQAEDEATIDEVRALFAELWEAAEVLTPTIFDKFAASWRANRHLDPDAEIEKAVGKVAAPNVNASSRSVSRERLFLQTLRRRVHEVYQPAFRQVSDQLARLNLRRKDLSALGIEHEANRFLNWVRLQHAPGEDTWRRAPLRNESERIEMIRQLGEEWLHTNTTRVPADYFERLAAVRRTFAEEVTIGAASKEELTAALMSLHAFSEQLRFVRGGEAALAPTFWLENEDDIGRVRRSLRHLLFGRDDFIKRLHDQIYHPAYQLKRFGLYCALELFGTTQPHLYPPLNSRMIKALRFIGFDVKP